MRAWCLAAGLGVVSTLVACSPPGPASPPGPSDKDPSAAALLDTNTGEVLLPLSEYDLDDLGAERALVNRALYIDIGPCMRAAGFRFAAASALPGEPSDDRQFGIWFEPSARRFGFGAPPDPMDEAFTADAQAGGEAWAQALETCSASSLAKPEVAAFMPTQDLTTDGLAARLRTDAIRAAAADPLWAEARGEWSECLRSEGLDPPGEDTQWASRQSTDALESDAPLEMQITLATTEAACNTSVRLTQRLGDLVAAYQAPLITANQAALNEAKTRKQSMLDAARAFIARQG